MAQIRPGTAAGVLGDPGQQEREPAEDNVSADALFFPVVDGAQVDDLLHVAPAALDLEEQARRVGQRRPGPRGWRR